MGFFHKWFSDEKSDEDNPREEVNENVIDYDFGIISEQDIQQLFKDDTGKIDIEVKKICQNKVKKREAGYFDSIHWEYDDVIYVDFCYELTISSGQYSIQKALFSEKWRASGTWGRMAGKPLGEIDVEKAFEGCLRYITPLCDYMKSINNDGDYLGNTSYNLKQIFTGFFMEQNNRYSYGDFNFNEKRKIIMQRYFSFDYETKKQKSDRTLVYKEPFEWISFQFVVDRDEILYLKIFNSNGITCQYEVFEPDYRDEYEKAVATEGKVELVKLISSLPAPGTIKSQLLEKETIDHIIQCIVRKEDIEFTIHSNSHCHIFEEEKEEMIDEKLKVLGLQRGASIEDIASAFKRLSLRVHPDTIANKELDEEFIQFANKRFREIKEAYEYLKENY